MEADYIAEEEDFWKCRKHPSSRRRTGVCPSCLRDRLLLLCPDCANLRPCNCFPSSLSSSSSSSFSSHSYSIDPARSSVSGAIGSVGRVSSLIESEPAFRRTRSAAFLLLRRSRSDPVEEAAAAVEKGRRWGSFLGFLKGREKGEEEKFSRSRSVGVSILHSDSAATAGEGTLKAKKWQFPSPMRAFRQKKTTRVVQERSALCRG